MKKNWLLYLTGFFSGMSVMAIELGASRLLAPYFSSSQIVWTIVIGIIMIAMAAGNVIGGKMADKHPTPTRLFIWLFAAATWTMLIPLFGKFVISGVALVLAMFVTSNYLVWAALFSCILVFAFPLLVLGMITPNLVKYAVKDLAENGKTVGAIEAANTVGSIIGTFLPTFVTIPFIGTSLTFVVFASVLYVICLTYFIVKKKFMVRTVITAVLALAVGIVSNGIGIAYWQNNILYEGESVYNYLRVEETEDSVILSTNVLFGVQSVKMKDHSLTGMYYDYALAAPVMAGAKEDLSVLILGLGTGTFATQCVEYFGIEDITGVEIDGKIIDLAREYFSLPPSVNAVEGDGRAYLTYTDKKHDVIMVDAYQDITIPFQMSSKEFFALVKEHLTDCGVMVLNMNMRANAEGGINQYISDTVKSEFSSVYTAATSASGNVELFASDNFDCKQKLKENTAAVGNATVRGFMSNVLDKLQEETGGDYILTDDKAPVELLGMRVLDNMIVSELDYYKKKFSGMSLKELIELLFSGQLFN